MDSSTTLVYTKIPNVLFERLRVCAGPFGPSVNQMVQEMLDCALQCEEQWVVTVSEIAKSKKHFPVGVKVTSAQMEQLKSRQHLLKKLGYNVQISDLIIGLYLRSVQRENPCESWAQLVKLGFPKDDLLIKLFALKEGELIRVHPPMR